MTKVKSVKKANRRPPLKQYLTERLKYVPLTVIMAAFVAFCLGSVVYFAVIGRYRDITIAFVYMIMVVIFYAVEYALNVHVPIGYAAFLMLFILFCFLGASYNFYGKIPVLDDILHAAWGIVFSVMGIAIGKTLLGAPKSVKGVIGMILFGVGFSMLLSIIWEIYEFSGDNILHTMDMQQDTVVHHFHSFLLYGLEQFGGTYDNLHTVEIDGITKTIIMYGNGQVLELDGYLDLGLIDTMWDLIWCFATTVVFCVLLAVDWCKGKYLYRFIIPSLAGETFERFTTEEPEEEEEPNVAEETADNTVEEAAMEDK